MARFLIRQTDRDDIDKCLRGSRSIDRDRSTRETDGRLRIWTEIVQRWIRARNYHLREPRKYRPLVCENVRLRLSCCLVRVIEHAIQCTGIVYTERINDRIVDVRVFDCVLAVHVGGEGHCTTTNLGRQPGEAQPLKSLRLIISVHELVV